MDVVDFHYDLHDHGHTDVDDIHNDDDASASINYHATRLPASASANAAGLPTWLQPHSGASANAAGLPAWTVASASEPTIQLQLGFHNMGDDVVGSTETVVLRESGERMSR